jgi:hypothetical protein
MSAASQISEAVATVSQQVAQLLHRRAVDAAPTDIARLISTVASLDVACELCPHVRMLEPGSLPFCCVLFS